jgi:hypothetical protein
MRKVKVSKRVLSDLEQSIIDFMNLPSIDRMRRIMYCMYNTDTYDEDTIKIDPYLLPTFRELKSMYPTVRDEVLIRAILLRTIL